MKKISIFYFLFILPIALFSYDLTLVSEGESNYLATNWLFYINRIPLEGKLGSYQIKFIEQVNYRQQPLCVIYHLNPRGHILIPLYKEYPPIKSFSVVSDFNTTSEGFEYAVLEELRAAFDFLEEYNFGESEELEEAFEINSNQWNKFINLELETALLEEKFDLIPELERNDRRNFVLTDEFSNKLESTQARPLLSTKWNQGDPYWNWCPILGGKRCYVGCTATSMAQIMRYYKWPKEGKGSHSYYWSNGSKTLSASFGDSYDWDYMPNNTWEYDTNKEKDAVAELCYEVGVSIDMGYGTEGSGAYVYYVDDALKTYFKYSDAVKVVWRMDYSNADQWFNVLKNQRDLLRPLELAIYGYDLQDNEEIGHAVVVDGYLITDELKQVHINMGWGGYYDAYYTLDNIIVGDYYDFSSTFWQHAVIDIVPAAADQPPSVSITSPQNGDVVGKIITIKANATDDKGITKVEFYIDNALKATDNSQPYEWNWDTTKSSSGTHVLKARAYDTINQTAEHSIQVTVDQPPKISITSPSSGANVYGIVAIKTSVSDDFGIKKVQFYVNGGLSKTTQASPHIFNWGTNKIYNGTYTVKAVVYDTRNQTSQDQINLIRIPHAPVGLLGRKENNSSVLLEQYINVLTWQPNDLNIGISKYRIYQKDGENWALLAEVNADTSEYWHLNVGKDEKYSYVIKAVDEGDREGESAYLEVQ